MTEHPHAELISPRHEALQLARGAALLRALSLAGALLPSIRFIDAIRSIGLTTEQEAAVFAAVGKYEHGCK
jgi:hypothetical protein